MIDQPISRREALGTLLAFTGLGLRGQGGKPGAGAESPVGDLMDPARAGRLRARVTQYENDPFVVGVEGKIRCTCGCNLSVYTCRTTDFSCETSPAMHARVIELVEEHKTAQEILDAFVGQYGEAVLMAPPKRGFNIAGYVVPGIAIVLAGAVLTRVILRRTRAVAVALPGTRGAAPDTGATLAPEAAARVRSELEKFEP